MMRLAALAVVAAGAALSQSPDAQTATFHAGTRLVEVEVVVRNKTGPVTGLNKNDFVVLDQGKPQRIDVFHAGLPRDQHPVPLPPNAVSNRFAGTGEHLPNATAVLIDMLNTSPDLKAYEKKSLTKLVRSMDAHDRMAIYWLGRDLHVAQEFTDDPARLIEALAKLDSGRDLMPATLEGAMLDLPTDAGGNIEESALMNRFDPVGAAMNRNSIDNLAGLTVQVYGGLNADTTVQALMRIISHLAGMPGRRNLVWLKQSLFIPPPIMGMLQQANIHLYPVLIRTVSTTDPDFLDKQHRVQAIAALSGGTGFSDAADLQLAVKTAQEDSETAYTLGYYPSEDSLDGKFHTVTVKLAAPLQYDLRYRSGYLAARQEPVRPLLPAKAAITQLFQNPLDATALGITAQYDPASPPGLHRLLITVDLRDLHLSHEGRRSTTKLQMGFLVGPKVDVRIVNVDVDDAHLAEVLEKGYRFRVTGLPVTGHPLRLMVRDPSTGVAGSLTIPVQPTPAAQNR